MVEGVGLDRVTSADCPQHLILLRSLGIEGVQQCVADEDGEADGIDTEKDGGVRHETLLHTSFFVADSGGGGNHITFSVRHSC